FEPHHNNDYEVDARTVANTVRDYVQNIWGDKPCGMLQATGIDSISRQSFSHGVPVNSEFIDAANRGDLSKVKQLLLKGVNVNSFDENRQTALMGAAANGHRSVVGVLLENHADPNLRNIRGGTALMMAASKGHLEVIRVLLSSGADPNIDSDNSLTVLMIAACGVNTSSPEIVNLLLDAGANVNAQNSDGETALIQAAH